MKDLPRFTLILTLFSLIAAGSLGWVHKITEPEILARRERDVRGALSHVLKGTEQGIIVPEKENGEIIYYKGFSNQNQSQLVGYAFVAVGKGYSSDIQTLVGMDSAGKILAIQIISQKETPGLGTKCEEIKSGETESWWQKQFEGQKALIVAVDKDNGMIQSISAATITSRAITDAIQKRSVEILNKISTGLTKGLQLETGASEK